MKRVSIFLFVCLLSITPALRAQDAAAASAKADRDAAEERYKRLNSALEDLLATQNEQQKRIAALVKEVENLREQMSKPSGNYASQDDLRALAKTVEKIEQKRVEDNERIVKEIAKLGKVVAPSTPPKKSAGTGTPVVTDTPSASDKEHYKHVVQSGDTLSTIAQAFREKGIKVSVDQILKANPKLDPNKMRVGQEIIIPVPEK